MKKRWRPLVYAGGTAFVLGVASAVFFSHATGIKRPDAVPTLLYPYLAAASLFGTTCVWIIVTVHGALEDAVRKRSARLWSLSFFVITLVVLVFLFLGGSIGAKAVKSINWYLFGGPADILSQSDSFCELLKEWWNYVSSVGIAAALATVVFLGIACNASSDKADSAECASEVISAGRNMQRLMTLASTLMVTSTLTSYLLFGCADQIQSERLRQENHVVDAATAAASGVTLRVPVQCERATGQAAMECTLSLASADEKRKASSSAAYMALVVGLAFTGALFMLFFTCSAAVDDASQRIADDAMRKARSHRAGATFSVKTWKEEQGLLEESATDKVLKALALLAPALTGALTLIVGA